MNRLATIKTILWGLAGILATVTIARFAFGLGAMTNLSDATPWGLWIAFDVMAGVALAAGGFVLAGTVYVFRLEKYRPLVRPAVLTAFLGYAAVAVGLLYDLGIPWHVLHPIVYPQPHSVLFEVAMCVMLYLTVLFLEFSPAILEHRWFGATGFQRIHKVVKKATIVLVIAGIVLSTLHQSSLGSLFLIAPFRVHPLWYSPIIWVLFLVSAIALGLMMVTLESFFSGWLFGHRLRTELLARLGRAASFVLFLYVALRLGDLAFRGVLTRSLDGSPLSWLFVAELLLGALLPAVLLALPRVRNHPSGLLVSSMLTTLGIVGYRFNVCIVAFARPDNAGYFPAWTEIAVSVGIVAAALLVFVFFAENLKVFVDSHAQSTPDPSSRSYDRFDPHAMANYLPQSLAGPRSYSLAFVVGVALATALLPMDSILSEGYQETPVSKARQIAGISIEESAGRLQEPGLARQRAPATSDNRLQDFMAIDGNRDGRLVLFPHEAHTRKLGDRESCGICHHLSVPFELNSSCSRCHSDMYSSTDMFNHQSHVTKLGGSAGCVRCHATAAQVKTRQTSTACTECHPEVKGSHQMIPSSARGRQGFVVGYMDAMHGLCVRCHEDKVKEEPSRFAADFVRCTHCHRDPIGVETR